MNFKNIITKTLKIIITTSLIRLKIFTKISKYEILIEKKEIYIFLIFYFLMLEYESDYNKGRI